MRSQWQKILAVFVVLLGFPLLIFGLTQLQRKSSQSQEPLPTYFTYTTGELGTLRSLKSTLYIKTGHLWQWEEIAFEAVGTAKADATLASKFYAYLFVAQRDAAYLSWNAPEGFQQLEAIKNIFAGLTDKQKSTIAFWAGGSGTKTPPGIWLKNVSEALKSSNTPLKESSIHSLSFGDGACRY